MVRQSVIDLDTFLHSGTLLCSGRQISSRFWTSTLESKTEYLDQTDKYFLVPCTLMSSTPSGPRDSGADRSLVCNECDGMKFETAQDLAEHNRKEHRVSQSEPDISGNEIE
jgi:hypothetical protein